MMSKGLQLNSKKFLYTLLYYKIYVKTKKIPEVNNLDFIAHIREFDGKIQSVKEHLLRTKKIAERIGEKIGIKHISGLAGMLHDLGKYSIEFRNYILEAVNNPDSPPRKGSVDHSTAGGKLLFKQFHTNEGKKYHELLAEIVGNAIISHHSYLHDFLSPSLESKYLKRVQEKDLREFPFSVSKFYENVMTEKDFLECVDKAAVELQRFLSNTKVRLEAGLMFLTKYIFSALIDADRTDTRLFEENKDSEPEIHHEILIEHYYHKLMNKINSFQQQKDAQSPINKLRTQMSQQCELFAEKPTGIYTLSIPTGGGKTFASLRYALKHAIQKGKERIIYVLPYTTIIEQNAAEVRSILEDPEHILEHHSNIYEEKVEDYEENEEFSRIKQKLELAKDNWDSPIIFTTLVQFLDVFYASGSSNIRRLHNLVNSVVIFDEVQKVPVKCITLFNEALNFLKNVGNSTIVLCTATQPALDFVEQSLDINNNSEMVPNLNKVVNAFKRVEIVDLASRRKFNNETLSEFALSRLAGVDNVLIILNTKSVTKRLYEKLKKKVEPGISIYHLSTSMCAAHRKEILKEIKEKLGKEKIICVSTQLIEAGVDISFKCVIRSLAGLDSIAQAAGRCNRNGEEDLRKVYVIDHEEESLDLLREIKVGKEISRKIFKDIQLNPLNYGGNILSPQAMEKYFKEFYSSLKSDLNYFVPVLKKNLTDLLFVSKRFSVYHKAYLSKNNKKPLPLFLVNSFKTAAEHFSVIDNNTTSVIVPYKKGKRIIADLNGEMTIEEMGQIMKEAQQYSINLFKNELEELSRNRGIESVLNGKVLVLKDGAYNQEYGLNLENDSALDTLLY